MRKGTGNPAAAPALITQIGGDIEIHRNIAVLEPQTRELLTPAEAPQLAPNHPPAIHRGAAAFQHVRLRDAGTEGALRAAETPINAMTMSDSKRDDQHHLDQEKSALISISNFPISNFQNGRERGFVTRSSWPARQGCGSQNRARPPHTGPNSSGGASDIGDGQ